MKCVLALLLASATPAAGQATFLGRFSVTSQTSSYMSSSMMVAGRDGQMHTQTHEVRTQVDHNHGVHHEMTTESRCTDGHCQGHMSMLSMPEGPSRYQRMRMSLRELLTRLTETRYRQPLQPASQPAMGAMAALVLPAPARVVFLGPRPHMQAEHPQPPPVMAPAPEVVSKNPLESSLVKLPLVMLVVSALVGLELMKRCRGSSEARELTGLAEPFATEQEQAIAPAAQPKATEPAESVEVAQAAAKRFLGSVVSQVEAKMQAAEKEATGAYMMRVYERAAA